MQRVVLAVLLLTACATMNHGGALVAPEDMKYTATADQGYTPKGHYSCAMETATGTNHRVRVCRYDEDTRGDQVRRERTRDDMVQNSLSGTPVKP